MEYRKTRKKVTRSDLIRHFEEKSDRELDLAWREFYAKIARSLRSL
jgi:hypothetical protein